MKKIIASLIILMLMVTSCGLVFAEPETDDGTGTTSGTDTETGTGEDGNEEETPTPNVTLNMTEEFTTSVDATSVTIKLGIGTIQNLAEGTLISFRGILQYDTTIFSEVTVEGLNGYTATYAPETQRIVLDPKEAVEATEVANITFTLVEGVSPCTTSIKFQVEEFTDGTNDFELETYTSSISIRETTPEQPEQPDDTENPDDDQNQTPTDSNDTNNTNTPKEDNTIAGQDLPKAGMKTLITLIAIVGIVGVLALVRYKKIQIK